jgi:AcrR family transcriptional regulator
MSRRDDIVAAARDLLEAEGEDALTMRAIADRVGMRAPSLYKHITGKEELEVALVALGLAEQAELFETAVATAPDPVAAIAADYRAWAARHPHLYRLMNDRPLPRERLPEGLETRVLAPVLTALGGDRTRARAMWAFAHGMVSLELAGRFPEDADPAAAWAVGLAGITTVDTVEMDSTATHEDGHRP